MRSAAAAGRVACELNAPSRTPAQGFRGVLPPKQNTSAASPRRLVEVLVMSAVLSDVLRDHGGSAALRARDPHSTVARTADARTGAPVSPAAVDGLRFRGEFLADGSPGPGRGRRADGARECRVLAGDLPRTHAGRSSR